MNIWGIFFLSLVIIVLLGGSVWYISQKDFVSEQLQEEEASIESSALLPVQARLVPVESGVAGDQEVSEFGDIAELNAIDSQEGRGLAMRSYDGTRFVHSIEASLPEMPTGSFYEGWLVNSENSEEFISTGVLTPNENEWRLFYRSDEVPMGMSMVVVSVESAEVGQDGEMGERILEGAF